MGRRQGRFRCTEQVVRILVQPSVDKSGAAGGPVIIAQFGVGDTSRALDAGSGKHFPLVACRELTRIVRILLFGGYIARRRTWRNLRAERARYGRAAGTREFLRGGG